MGMTDPELNAAYALDALDDDEALVVEATLATSADDAHDVAVLAHAAGEYSAAMTPGEDPSGDLRERVLDAAFASRAPGPTTPADPREVHRIELGRLVELLRRLSDDDWQRPVDPPEFAGWTVHDLAVHVTAAETLFAQLLGSPVPGVPETDGGNESRTALAQQRHRRLPPEVVIAELTDAAMRVDDALECLSPGELDTDELVWWGTPMRVSTVCIHRGFETWTHADDIRRAVGRTQLAPPAPSLRTMSTRAAEWAGLMLAAAGHSLEPAAAVIDLTGPGGTRHLTQLNAEVAAPDDNEPRFTLRLDVVDYCRAIAARMDPSLIVYEADGDRKMAALLVGALPSLAGL